MPANYPQRIWNIKGTFSVVLSFSSFHTFAKCVILLSSEHVRFMTGFLCSPVGQKPKCQPGGDSRGTITQHHEQPTS